MTKGEQFPALTGLRFFLALWVILHHLTGPGQMLEPAALSLPHPIYMLVRGGYLAVTTFFMLSGFVLARSYPGRIQFGLYAAGRVARVYPVYLLSLLVVVPFIAADQTAHRGAYVAAHLTLIQAWIARIPVNWNTPAWSLSCEMFFYLLFPFAALAIGRAGRRGTILIALGAVWLTRVFWMIGVSDDIKPIIHLSDFLMGIAASRFFDLQRESGSMPRGQWIYLPALAASALLIAFPPREITTPLRPLNALLLIGLALGGGSVARALSSRAIVYLGKSSYAMYILHVPLLWWYLRWSKTFSTVLYLGGVILISMLVHGLLEEPANRWLRARARRALQA
jgi:peptidoglycan/LPS O-acetylase OafA/YrhL